MKIVFLDEYSLGGVDLAPIRSLGDYVGYEITTTAQEVIERCWDAQVVITNKVVLNRQTLAQLKSLRMVCVAATGVNNVDTVAAAQLGIEVRNAVGYSTQSVAEATLASALALVRHIGYYDNYIKSGSYFQSDRLFNFDRQIGQLCGRRWGIVGMGAIGRRVAELASAFGCEVNYFSVSGAVRHESWPRVEQLDELLATSDVVSIHSPLTAQTAGLIGAREIGLMPSHAILINVARGGIVDEVALSNALNSRSIAAAALDVFSSEPLPATSPLLAVDNKEQLLLSPHNAWSADRAIERLVVAIVENIKLLN
ncbi:MAG: NAD(P)-dependent oxidoreductase [Rikenellaceae bacterium]